MTTTPSLPPSGSDAVYADIRAERARQDAQWGGAAHDDEHSAGDWFAYRQKFERRVLDGLDSPAVVRADLVKVAALAVAQIEVLDRSEANDA